MRWGKKLFRKVDPFGFGTVEDFESFFNFFEGKNIEVFEFKSALLFREMLLEGEVVGFENLRFMIYHVVVGKRNFVPSTTEKN